MVYLLAVLISNTRVVGVHSPPAGVFIYTTTLHQANVELKHLHRVLLAASRGVHLHYHSTPG